MLLFEKKKNHKKERITITSQSCSYKVKTIIKPAKQPTMKPKEQIISRRIRLRIDQHIQPKQSMELVSK